MARKDEILRSFLSHELLVSKYEIPKSDIPSTVREALNSEIPVIKAMALIIEGLENKPPVTDNDLRNQVTRFLNETI